MICAMLFACWLLGSVRAQVPQWSDWSDRRDLQSTSAGIGEVEWSCDARVLAW